MGQYYLVANADNFEYLDAHEFDDGLKLLELSSSGSGTMAALCASLVLDETRRGPWAGNRVVVTGDYADEGRFVPPAHSTKNLYTFLRQDDDDEAAAAGGAPDEVNASSETALALALQGSPVPVAVSGLARGWAHQLGLGLEVRSRDVANVATQPLAAYADDARVYDQPEDLVEAFQLAVGTPKSSVDDIMCELRMTKQPSSLSWHTVTASAIKVSAQTGKATEWTIELADRHGTSKPVKRQLTFPATGRDVKAWLQIVFKTPEQQARARFRL